MSVEPDHRLIMRMNKLAGKSGRALDHDNGYLKVSSRQYFGIRRRSTGILGDEDGYFFSFQQSLLIINREWAAGKDQLCRGRQRGFIRLVDRSDQVAVLRCTGERVERQSSHGQKYVLGRFADCECGSIGIGNCNPLIPRRSAPSWPGKGEPRYVKTATGRKGVSRHGGSKRVGCVDQGSEFFANNGVAKPINAAKPADTMGNRWNQRRLRSTSEGNHCADTRFFGKKVSKRGCFGCASKDQQTGRVLYHRQFLVLSCG